MAGCMGLSKIMIFKFLYPRCKTCKFWGKSEDGRYVDPNRGVCNHPKMHDDYGGVATDELNYEYSEGGLYVTGPEFGCIHHVKP